VVSRTRAFTIAAAWIVAGLAAGIVALAATTGALTDGLRPVATAGLLFLPASLIVAGVWVGAGARHARSAEGRGGAGGPVRLGGSPGSRHSAGGAEPSPRRRGAL